jgi:YbbR domain-containing protein
MATRSPKFDSSQSGVVKRVLVRLFVNDWQLKLVALVVTLALWIGVTGLKTPTTARLKGVALILNVRGDVEVTSSAVEFVDLVVSGDKRKVDLLNPRNLVASLDLSNEAPGERAVQVTPSNLKIELPTGVELEAVEPGIVPVTLERVLERELPVKVDTVGTVGSGFELYSAVANPSRITIRGPETAVRGVESVLTEKVNLKGRQESFGLAAIGLQTVGPKVRTNSAVVSVTVRIGGKRSEKQFTVPVSVEAKKRTAVITLYGPPDELAELKSEEISVRATLERDGTPSMEITLPSRFQGSVEVRKKILR